jgi:uncharacterized protein YfaS (alpha-2-macroglobulin family)
MLRKLNLNSNSNTIRLLSIALIFLFYSCTWVDSAKLGIRKIQRYLFPQNCSVEVDLNTVGYEYFEDRYGVKFNFSEPVEEAEFVPFVQFEPEAKFNRFKYGSGELTRYSNNSISIEEWDLVPGVAYKVSVKPFFSEKDCKMKETATFEIPATQYRPNFSLSYNNIIESESNRIYPIQVTNLSELQVQYANIGISQLTNAIAKSGSAYQNSDNGLSWSKINWKVENKFNENGEQGFPLKNVMGNSKKSWVALKVSQNVVEYGSYDKKLKTEYTIIQSTNIGMTAKEDNDYVYIWLNSLSKAEPIFNSITTLYSNSSVLGSCATDKEGYCKIAKSSSLNPEKTILVAESSDDKAYLYLNGKKLYQQFYYSNTGMLSGKIYFDRKLYRPGEKVEIKAVLGERKKNSFSALSNRNVNVQINNTQGKTVLNKSLTTSNQGGVWFDYSIPSDTPLGHYTVYVKEANSNTISSDSFQVEEFRPVSFGVKIETDKTNIIQESEIEFKIQANYLFGTPMGNSKYKYSILKKNYSNDPIGYDDYVFGYQSDYYEYEDYQSEDSSGYISGDEGTLDKNGAAIIKTDIATAKSTFKTENESIEISDPFNISIEATVFDVDEKSVTKTTSLSYFPSTASIGIKCDDRYKPIQQPLSFQMVAVGLGGKNVENHKVTAYIIHNDWSSVESKGFASSLFRSNSIELKTIETKDLKLGNKPLKFDYTPKYPGSHTLLVVDSNGGYSRMDFYAYKKESFYSWDFRSDDSIQLTTDKPSYKIGDTAKIIIKSPYPEARAILSIERDQLYWSKTINIKGNSEPIEIPITEDYLPNVEFNVVLLTGRLNPPKDLTEEDKKEFVAYDFGVPKVKMGGVQLKINIDSKNAPIELKLNKQEYAPREQVVLKIKTLPKSEVLISVADRGILDLVGYKFTSPVNQFYRLWNSIVSTYDFRDWIVKQTQYEGKGDSPGGDYGDDQSDGGFGKSSEDGTRKDFRPTAFWNPNIITDSDGEAEVKFNLPDNLTTFRVMATAAKDGRYASQNIEFIVKKSLILKKNAPRFVRINDSIQIGATITNNTKIKGKFKIGIESKDLKLSNAQSTLELNAFETKEFTTKLTFTSENYKAIFEKSKENNMELTYKVKAEPENFEPFTKIGLNKNDLIDAMEVNFPIKSPEPVLTNRISGFTDSSEKFTLNFPAEEKVLLRQASIQLNLSATVLTGLKNAFDFYSSSPYFCMEQRTSAYLLTISAGNLLKQFKYTPPNKDSYDFNNIEKLFLDEMSSFQNSDGSFRLWKESNYSYGYPYLTAYVIHTMQMAKKYGYRTNTVAYNNGIKYLKESIKNPKENERDSFQTLSLLYSILSRDGMDTQGLEKSIIDNFSKLNPKSQGIFLAAYFDAKNVSSFSQDPKLVTLYKSYMNQFQFSTDSVKVIEDSKKENDYWLSYYSKGSALAGLLSVMIRFEPEHKSLPNLIRFILSSKAGNLWMDTQSSATLAFALREYRDKFEATESDTDFEINVGTKELIDDSISNDDNSIQQFEYKLSSISSDWKFPSKDLIFQRTSDEGRLYFTSTLNYTPLKEDTKATSSGFKVEKNIYSIHGKDNKGEFKLEKEGSKLKRGTTYVVKLNISSETDRNFVMIEDFLPSNAEVVNTSFETESSEYSSLDSGESDNKKWWENSPTIHEYRDDKVLFSKDFLSAGEHEFTYLLRPLSVGNSILPATKVFMMYNISSFGNTSTANIQVE